MPHNHLPQNLKAADDGGREHDVLVACAGVTLEKVDSIYQFLFVAPEEGVELVDLGLDFLAIFVAHAGVAAVASDEVVRQFAAEDEAHEEAGGFQVVLIQLF